jgi:hypothetical protein
VQEVPPAVGDPQMQPGDTLAGRGPVRGVLGCAGQLPVRPRQGTLCGLQARLDGGLAYTAESLRWTFADLVEVELRPMRTGTPHFGEPFLHTALFRRP